MARVLKAVFFDLYGTIAGFEPDRFEVQSRVCAEFGITLTREGVLRGYADADAYLNRENAVLPMGRRTPAQKTAIFEEYTRRVIRGSGVEVSLETAGKIWHRIQQTPAGLAPFPDAAPTLRALRERGLLTGLISNMDAGGDRLVTELGLAGLFDLAVTSGDVGAAKPNPAIFRAALYRSGVQAGEAVHVGDPAIVRCPGRSRRRHPPRPHRPRRESPPLPRVPPHRQPLRAASPPRRHGQLNRGRLLA